MTSNFALWDTEKNEVIAYPRNDNKPVVNLNPRYLVLKIVKEEKPDDVEGFIVQQKLTVDLDAGEWRHGWELIELPTPIPQPEWGSFKRSLLAHSEINALLNGGITAAPAAALSIPATLLNASSGAAVDDFRAAWLTLRRLGLVSAELLQEVRELAIKSNLPQAFIGALGGGTKPAAQYIGQEWMDNAGDLWRVEQTLVSEGELLTWVKVEA